MLSDDSYAWYMQFDPSTCLYRIRNAKSGRYFSYTSSVIKTSATTTPGEKEFFHLMNARIEKQVGTEEYGIKTRGYWILAGNDVESPLALTATDNGKTSAPLFNITDAATVQCWIILTSEQVNKLEFDGIDIQREKLQRLIAGAQGMLNVENTESVEGTTARLQALTDELAAKEPNMKTVSELIGGVNNISETILDFLKNTTPADLNSPYDITFMMENSAMTDTEIWGQVPEQADGIGQFKDEAFTMQQSVLSMPKGVYGLSLQAFQRPCSSADLASKYADGTLKATASITSRSIKKVKTIMDEAQPSPLGQGRDLQVGHLYVPDDTRSAAAYFAAGLYDNMVIFNLLKATDINLKISNTNTSVGDWTCIGNLRLFYYGYNTKLSEVTYVNAIPADTAAPSSVYSVS